MTRLLNIRLSDDDHARVQRLKARGIKVSELVRHAIRAEDQNAAARVRTATDMRRILEDLDQKYPINGTLERPADLTDRVAVRQYIVERLKRKTRK